MTLQSTSVLSSVALLAVLLSAPAHAERLLRLNESPIGEIDPAKATDYNDTVLVTNIYDTLVTPKQGGPGVQPSLATEWTVDDVVYTFKLKPGVKFHSGNTVSADDVVFSFNRLTAMGLGLSSLFEGRVDKVEAVDPTTVRFTLKQPYAPFLAALVRLSVVDSKLVKANLADGTFGEFKDYGAAYLSAHDAGSGAYKVFAQNPQTETEMVAFPDYFKGFAPNFPERVRYRYGLEASTVRAAISRGEHELSDLWLPPEVIKAMAGEAGVQLYSEGGATGEYIKMNTQRAPTDDVHCRLALTYAFDYGTALKLLKINDKFAQGIPANGPLPSGLLGHDTAPAFKQDMEKAKAELKQCKYDPAKTTLDIGWIAEVPARERLALLMQSTFQKLGFTVTVTRMPWALYSEQVTKVATTPNLSEVSVAALTPDPDSLLYNMYSSKAPSSWMSAEHVVDAETDKLLDAGRAETDDSKRAAIYASLSGHLRDIAPSIYAYELTGVFVARKALSVPTLSDPAKKTIDNFNLDFREMSLAE